MNDHQLSSAYTSLNMIWDAAEQARGFSHAHSLVMQAYWSLSNEIARAVYQRAVAQQYALDKPCAENSGH